MTTVYQCDVFCDVCNDWTGDHGTQHFNADGMGREALRNAKERGWLRRFNKAESRMEDVCPQCLEKSK